MDAINKIGNENETMVKIVPGPKPFMAEGILPDHKRVDIKQIKANKADGMSSQRLKEPYKLSEI